MVLGETFSSAGRRRKKLQSAAQSGSPGDMISVFDLVFETDPADPGDVDCLLEFFNRFVVSNKTPKRKILPGLQHLASGLRLNPEQEQKLSDIYLILVRNALKGDQTNEAVSFGLAGYRNPAIDKSHKHQILALLDEQWQNKKVFDALRSEMDKGAVGPLFKDLKTLPGQPQMSFLLALAQYRLGRYQEAADTLAPTQGMEDPPSARLRAVIEASSFFCGCAKTMPKADKKKLLAWLDVLGEPHRDDRLFGAAMYHVRGRLFADSGRLKDAVECFLEAAKKKPEPLYLYYLVHSLQLVGRWENSLQILDKFNSDAPVFLCLRLCLVLRKNGSISEKEAMMKAGVKDAASTPALVQLKYALLAGRPIPKTVVAHGAAREVEEEWLRIALPAALAARDMPKVKTLMKSALYLSLPIGERAFFEGAFLWLNGDLQKAETSLTLALKETPVSPGPLKYLGAVQLDKGYTERAIENLKEASKYVQDNETIELLVRGLEEIKSSSPLTPDDHFLLCRLLTNLNRTKEAKEEFKKLDFNLVKENKRAIVELARKVVELPRVEPVLRSALNENPTSVELLSLLCGLCRFYRNRFGESITLIRKIERLKPRHPWAIIGKCIRDLDKNNLNSAVSLMQTLPKKGIWKEETKFMEVRIELKKGHMREAKDILGCIQRKSRLDFKYLTALIQTHEGKFEEAYEIASSIPDDEYFQDKVVTLRGRLLLALGHYKESIKMLNMASGKESNIYKAWACLSLKMYDEAFALIGAKCNDEELYLTALLYDLKNEDKQAYRSYKEFIQKAGKDNSYRPKAVDRFSYYVTMNDNIDDAEWLLNNLSFRKYISRDHLVHLYAVKKSWHEALQLLLVEKKESDLDNLMFTGQQLFILFTNEKRWNEAEELLEKMPDLSGSNESHEAYLRKKILLDKIRKSKEGIDYDALGKTNDGLIKAALGLHKLVYGNGNFQVEDIINEMETQTENNLHTPKMVLLLLIINLTANNNAKATELAQKLDGLIGDFQDDIMKIIAKTFISVALDIQKLPYNDLLKFETSLNPKLPVTKESFWNRAVLAMAHKDTRSASKLAESLEGKVAIVQGTIAGLYAIKALKKIEAGQELTAVKDLEKAINFGAMQ